MSDVNDRAKRVADAVWAAAKRDEDSPAAVVAGILLAASFAAHRFGHSYEQLRLQLDACWRAHELDGDGTRLAIVEPREFADIVAELSARRRH